MSYHTASCIATCLRSTMHTARPVNHTRARTSSLSLSPHTHTNTRAHTRAPANIVPLFDAPPNMNIAPPRHTAVCACRGAGAGDPPGAKYHASVSSGSTHTSLKSLCNEAERRRAGDTHRHTRPHCDTQAHARTHTRVPRSRQLYSRTRLHRRARARRRSRSWRGPQTRQQQASPPLGPTAHPPHPPCPAASSPECRSCRTPTCHRGASCTRRRRTRTRSRPRRRTRS